MVRQRHEGEGTKGKKDPQEAEKKKKNLAGERIVRQNETQEVN